MIRRVACVLSAACLSVAGCTADSGHPIPAPTTRPEPPAVADTLTCANGMGTKLRGLHLQPVLGVVALPAEPTAAALGTARLKDPGLPRLFAKSALLVRAGATFELSTAHGSPKSLAFSWHPHQGSPAPTRSLVVRGCRSTSNSTWLAFIGGYYIDHSSCVALIVRTSTAQRRVRIGLGAPCAGQQPPVGPSQR
jgi:hypothetical protein